MPRRAAFMLRATLRLKCHIDAAAGYVHAVIYAMLISPLRRLIFTAFAFFRCQPLRLELIITEILLITLTMPCADTPLFAALPLFGAAGFATCCH